MNDEIYELKDVQVDTLGLVSRGANGEDFFLLKTEDTNAEIAGGDEVQASDQSEMEEKVTKTIWQKLIDLFKQEIVEIEESQQVPDEVEVVNTDKQETEIIQEEVVQEEVMEEEKSVAVEEEETQKGEDTMPTEELISKADFEKAQSEIAELKKALEDEKVEKAKLGWISKASEFGYVPVSSKELAEHLYNLAKYDSKEADWLVDLLKSYDAMLEDSGLFAEKGTNKIETDAVAKALNSENVKDALLSLSRKDAEAYLREMRARSRG